MALLGIEIAERGTHDIKVVHGEEFLRGGKMGVEYVLLALGQVSTGERLARYVAAMRYGIRTLLQNALNRAAQGLTTIEPMLEHTLTN